MLLDDARRAARFDGGELVLLNDQDRARWDAAEIAELNRAIAVAEADGAEAGLALVEPLDLDGYQYAEVGA